MNKKFILFLPLILLLSICLLLFVGLHKDPKQIASALINKPVPEFYQANSSFARSAQSGTRDPDSLAGTLQTRIDPIPERTGCPTLTAQL